ncbi:MAG TPA: pyrroline-5-carboxylate reductase [Gammaproteobacteria bacterium]
MQRDLRILLIGFGNMGRALAEGWLARGVAPSVVRVVDPQPAARQAAAAMGLAAHAEAPGPREPADVVVVAVKPPQVEEVLRRCRDLPAPSGRPVFLSIAAGKTLAHMLAALGNDAAAVRAMPNTPAAVGKGMTVLTASPAVTAAQRDICTELLAAVGTVDWVDDERLMDAVTAVSGSGPAYVFLLIESLEAAAADAGLSPALARKLAVATVAGAGAYAEASGEPAATLRARVTSPGGTTQAALAVLMADDGLPELMKRAVRAAAARSRELAAE